MNTTFPLPKTIFWHNLIRPISSEKNKLTPITLDPFKEDYFSEFLSICLAGGSPLLIQSNQSLEHILSLNLPGQHIGVQTSGSSGVPKIILISIESLLQSIESYFSFFPKYNESNISLVTLPQNHMGGLMISLRAYIQGTQVTWPDSKLSLIEKINKFQPHQISLVPSQLSRCMEENISYFPQYFLIGGSGLDIKLLQKARLRGFTICPSYGSTEGCAVSVSQHPERPLDDPSIGEILPNRSLKVVDDHLHLGKYARASAQIIDSKIQWFDNEFLLTNDKVEIQGPNLKFIGRSDLIYISGGKNIDPIEIENKLISNAIIESGLIIPIKDSYWGEKTILIVDKLIDLYDFYEKSRTVLLDFQMPKEILLKEDLFRKKPNRESLKIWAQKECKKPSLLFIHGFMGSFENALFLSSCPNFRLYSLTLPGHGHKAITKKKSALFNDFESIISKYSIQYLYGYSMGGRLLIEFLKKRKINTLLGVILESTSLGHSSSKQEIEKRLKWENDLFDSSKGHNSKRFLKEWYSQDLFKKLKESANYEKSIEIALKNGNFETWKDSMNFYSITKFPDLNINNLKFPILYLCGELDSKYRKQSKQLKHGVFLKKIIIKNASHRINLMNQKELIRELTLFMAQTYKIS